MKNMDKLKIKIPRGCVGFSRQFNPGRAFNITSGIDRARVGAERM